MSNAPKWPREPSVIVEYGKHGERFYDALTPEKFGANAQGILKQRFDEGYYYYEPEPPKEYVGLSIEEIRALKGKDAELYKKAVVKWNKHIQAKKEYKQEKAEWDKIVELVNSDEVVWDTYGKEGTYYYRQVPRAWEILTDRNDYEYERLELESLQDA